MPLAKSGGTAFPPSLMPFKLTDYLSRYLGKPAGSPTSQPLLSEGISALFLHFDDEAIQSAMVKSQPERLVLGYTQTMMGFLLFQPAPRRIEMIGLGGGSLAKYCRKHLPAAHFTAIEINPKVIALRTRFNIPPDSEHFEVVCANGADYVRGNGAIADILMIDGFKPHGQPESLCSEEFYRACYARLGGNGVLVANLLDDDRHYPDYLARIRRCFHGQVLEIDAESRGNRIVFAGKGENFPPSAQAVQASIDPLESSHRLPIRSIAEKILAALEAWHAI